MYKRNKVVENDETVVVDLAAHSNTYPLSAWNSLNTARMWKSILLVKSRVSSVALYCATTSWC